MFNHFYQCHLDIHFMELLQKNVINNSRTKNCSKRENPFAFYWFFIVQIFFLHIISTQRQELQYKKLK